MGEQRCIHELLPGQCAICNPRVPVNLDDVQVIARFQAQFAGRCDHCDGPVRVGDQAGYDQDRELICQTCLFAMGTRMP